MLVSNQQFSCHWEYQVVDNQISPWPDISLSKVYTLDQDNSKFKTGIEENYKYLYLWNILLRSTLVYMQHSMNKTSFEKSNWGRLSVMVLLYFHHPDGSSPWWSRWKMNACIVQCCWFIKAFGVVCHQRFTSIPCDMIFYLPCSNSWPFFLYPFHILIDSDAKLRLVMLGFNFHTQHLTFSLWN